jgi:hypothetical protein
VWGLWQMPRASRRGGERQVRLKHQYADLYRGILPGEWVPAWVMAERLLALAEKAAIPSHERVCDPRHFDFRGGTSRGPELRDLHTRRSDIPAK